MSLSVYGRNLLVNMSADTPDSCFRNAYVELCLPSVCISVVYINGIRPWKLPESGGGAITLMLSLVQINGLMSFTGQGTEKLL